MVLFLGVGDENKLKLIVFVKRIEDESDNYVANATFTVTVHPLENDKVDSAFETVGDLAEESILTGMPIIFLLFFTSDMLSLSPSIKQFQCFSYTS